MIRNYLYGARPPLSERKRIEDQLYPAHRYRNDLVKNELDRRQASREKEAELEPAVAGMEAMAEACEAAIVGILAEIGKANTAAGRKRATTAERDRLAAARLAKRVCYRWLKILRALTRLRPDVQVALRAISETASAKVRQLRAACGVWWGTYLQAEDAAARACRELNPRLRAFDGNGEAATQIIHGITEEEALAGTDTRLQIGPLLHRQGNRRAPARIVKMRVGSNPDRTPIFAEIKISWHRPLPAGSVIQWVRLFRSRLGTTYHWQLMFVLKIPDETHPDQAKAGDVGVDVGWRLMDDGSIRMAAWSAGPEHEGEARIPAEIASGYRLMDDGSIRMTTWSTGLEHEGDVRIPADIVSAYRHSHETESRKKTAFNEMQIKLATWLAKQPDAPDNDEAVPGELAVGIPPWLRTAAQYLLLWKKAGRLQAIINQWRTDRFQGDAEIFAELEAWGKQDRHRWSSYRGEQKKVESKVREIQRRWVAWCRRNYKTAFVEKMNVRELQERPGVEDSRTADERQRYARLASVGRLLGWMRDSMAEVVAIPPEHLTHDCSFCGSRETWDQAVELEHTCSGCGKHWDQDLNAARNLLARGKVMNETPGTSRESAANGSPPRPARARQNRRRSQPATEPT